MGLVERFDRKLESTVGDAFARVFGGAVVPEEVEGMLRRAAADGVRSLQGGRLLAPNEYVITLSAPDHRKVLADPDITSDTFAKHLGGYIGEQGWQTYGDVVVRFEQSPSLHSGQVRARGVVNPDATVGGADIPEPAPPAAPQSDRASNAEPGVPPMSDNPSHRGGPGQGRPGDEYYDDRYGRPEDAPDPRAGYAPQAPPPPPPPESGGYPPQGEPNYPPRQGGYPDQGGYAPSYEQRPPAGGYGPPPPSGGYDQGYRQPYGPPSGGYPPQGEPPRGDYNYGRPPAPDYGRPEGRPDPRGGYPDQGGYEQGYQGAPNYGRPDYGQPEPGPGRGYEGGYGEPPRGDYDYGQPPAQGGYADYGQPAPAGDYPGAATVTLQLDDGSGRTYQLREGANVVGRGQDAQFRLPDTGVSRRHLEIRWDGQVALLSDLNSTNGTTVNNAPVQEWQLADGDVIRLGHSEIVVRVH